jgi:hypothetical protein
MDLVSKIIVGASLLYVGVMLYLLIQERNAETQERIDAEIDRLHK